MELNGYTLLANEIILTACKDFLNNKTSKEEFESFLYSDWFLLLTQIEPEVIYQYVMKLKEEGKNGNSIGTSFNCQRTDKENE